MKVLFGIWKLLDARQRRRLVALQVLLSENSNAGKLAHARGHS